jgi:putative ABC transport system permease protein
MLLFFKPVKGADKGAYKAEISQKLRGLSWLKGDSDNFLLFPGLQINRWNHIKYVKFGGWVIKFFTIGWCSFIISLVSKKNVQI